MTSDSHSKIPICSPAETVLAEVCERWFKEFKLEEYKPASIERVLSDKSVPLVVFFGSEFLKRIVHEPKLLSCLKGKVIYHIGGASDALFMLDINSIGIRAYFGYQDVSPSFIINAQEESLFRDAYLAGLKSLLNQETLGNALDKTKKAWEKLIARKSESIYAQMVRVFARATLRQLVLIGDKNWVAPSPNQLVIIRPPAIRIDRPRIEVVNLSPILLKWLQKDPARIAKLSPEQFEDLIAERLTHAGLIVTKTGKTNTPDGGIDLIAYPKSSSIPYLLAAQIKHSHKNQPISADVVRDFRGAITSFPIDVGLLVTNTRFTPNAQWTARQLPKLIRLRSMEDIKIWLANEIDESSILKDFPSSIEVAPGLVIPIPWSIE